MAPTPMLMPVGAGFARQDCLPNQRRPLRQSLICGPRRGTCRGSSWIHGTGRLSGVARLQGELRDWLKRPADSRGRYHRK